MPLGLLFVDVVYSTPAEHPHKPLFRELQAKATKLFQSKEQSSRMFTTGSWRIYTWARHRLSKEHTFNSSTLVSCLCPGISAGLSL